MNRMFLVCLAAAALACGGSDDKIEKVDTVHESEDVFDEVYEQAEMCKQRLREHQDASGFILTDKCDSTTFTEFLAEAGMEVDMEAAHDPKKPGRWYRRPVVGYKECYASGESRSTVSRDVLLSVMRWAWKNNRTDVVRNLYEYGESRDWFMGDGRLGGADTWMNPNMRNTLGRMLAKMGHPKPYLIRLPVVFDADSTGYVAYQTALHIDLRGEIVGHIRPQDFAVILALQERYPDDPLFEYLKAVWSDGDLKRTADLVRNSENRPDKCSWWECPADAGCVETVFMAYLLQTKRGDSDADSNSDDGSA